MAVIESIARQHQELTRWRRDLHAHPELGFEENRTAAIVADKLRGFGVEVFCGIGKTGVVGVLRSGSGKRSVLPPKIVLPKVVLPKVVVPMLPPKLIPKVLPKVSPL